QDVEKLPIRWTVRTDVRRVGRHQRVQRIEADDATTERRSAPDQLAQITEISHAPIARRTQRIELRGDTPGASTGGNGRWLVAMLGRHDQTQLTAEPGVQRDRGRVIAER